MTVSDLQDFFDFLRIEYDFEKIDIMQYFDPDNLFHVATMVEKAFVYSMCTVL